jgi:hypothetical protein
VHRALTAVLSAATAMCRHVKAWLRQRRKWQLAEVGASLLGAPETLPALEAGTADRARVHTFLTTLPGDFEELRRPTAGGGTSASGKLARGASQRASQGVSVAEEEPQLAHKPHGHHVHVAALDRDGTAELQVLRCNASSGL